MLQRPGRIATMPEIFSDALKIFSEPQTVSTVSVMSFGIWDTNAEPEPAPLRYTLYIDL